MNFEPNDGRVLVKLDDDDRSSGGLFLIGQTTSYKRATVLKAGHPPKDSNLTFYADEKVMVDSLGAVELRLEDQKLLLVRHQDILGKIWA